MFLCALRLPSFPPGVVPSRASANQNVAGSAPLYRIVEHRQDMCTRIELFQKAILIRSKKRRTSLRAGTRRLWADLIVRGTRPCAHDVSLSFAHATRNSAGRFLKARARGICNGRTRCSAPSHFVFKCSSATAGSLRAARLRAAKRRAVPLCELLATLGWGKAGGGIEPLAVSMSSRAAVEEQQ